MKVDRMTRITLIFLLSDLLLQLVQAEDHAKQLEQKVQFPGLQQKLDFCIKECMAKNTSSTEPTPPPELTSPPPTKALPPRLLSQECLLHSYTRLSCQKVFCPPWERCINGRCVCKVPNQCPRIGPRVCNMEQKQSLTLCHAQAVACRDKKPYFSHYYTENSVCDGGTFKMSLKGVEGQQVVEVNTVKGTLLICGSDTWNIAAANVICRYTYNDPRGAVESGTRAYKDIAGGTRVHKCVSVRCTGAERTLAECVLYQPQQLTDSTPVATVTCYNEQKDREKCDEFSCVNQKCVSWEHICDGLDHCGDNSDEMCCTGCRDGAFYCKSGVCIPHHAVGDQIRDCLGGEDELQTSIDSKTYTALKPSPDVKPEEEIWSNPTKDIQNARSHTEILQCGIPNLEYVYKTVEETRSKRRKRVVGGEEALPTQIQWQVAVQEDGKIHCGGAYLGGCWVLTAAHCVRKKPQAFRIKFSLWKKLSQQSTTDSVPVKDIIIHRDYNPRTYQNDIALIRLDELAHSKECLHPNPAVRSVCVPWSTLQFPPNHTCTISGWGRNKEGGSVYILKWANVSLIPNCKNYYKERFYTGMMCAGDLEGHVDSCQGDSGGPLVCKDESGLSYVWGIVSWGESCGEAGFPGVYTQVAHYFEWIRENTGWPAITKYNQ
ncbi:complement factor I isoform X2 [Silurus meridionalis]|uniref:complement factor I isoform X2 n=1 Tax=Silurus meridionalis TaxID=175797 RepID=UPI001EEA2083|nr:complement factor I isoform X2 [Silurus meridionalis]